MNITINNYEAFLLDYFEGNLSVELAEELKLFVFNHPELEIDLSDFDLISSNENDNITFNDKQKLKRKEFVINDDVIESLIISLVNGDLSQEETDKLVKVIQQDDNYTKMYRQYLAVVLEKENIQLSDKVLLKGHLPITNENIEYFLIAELENTLNHTERKALSDYKNAYPGVKELENAYAATQLNIAEKIVFADKKSLKKKETIVISLYSISRYVAVAAAACLILYFGFFTSTPENEIDFSFVSTSIEQNKGEEKLIANQIDNNKEEINSNPVKKEETLKQVQSITPKTNTTFLANQPKEKVKITPSIKEPVLDLANEDPIQENKFENDQPVLYAREEIKEIKNEDNYSLENTNTNLASLNEDDYISPGQYVRNWAKKTFFTEQANEKYSNETTELADNTLQLKGTNLKLQNTQSEDYKEYGFSLGKFSFHRKVKKKKKKD